MIFVRDLEEVPMPEMAPAGRIGKFEAWEIGLCSERVELRGREVWALADGATEMKREGELVDGMTVEEFWDECGEGLAK